MTRLAQRIASAFCPHCNALLIREVTVVREPSDDSYMVEPYKKPTRVRCVYEMTEEHGKAVR